MTNGIAGQVVIWDRGPNTGIIRDGRHILQIFGTLAANSQIATEAFTNPRVKYSLMGRYDDHLGLFLTGGLPEQREPFPPQQYYKYGSIEQLMCSPMWRV